MTAIILHLSDIHISDEKDPVLKLASEISSAMQSYLPEASHVFVVISGDIANTGFGEQYELAKIFITKIVDNIKSKCESEVSVITVPGNHDCNFKENNTARIGLISYLEGNMDSIDESVIDACTSVQNNFLSFQKDMDSSVDEGQSDKLWRVHRYEVEGKVIEFDALNISWVSKIKEEPGHMLFPVSYYGARETKSADIKIVVMHHPLNWFSQSIYRHFRKFVRSVADIVISGHEHQGNVGIIEEAESGKSSFIEGCVLQDDGAISSSSFNIISIDLDNTKFRSTRLQWGVDSYRASTVGSWSEYHDLPLKVNSKFPIESEFQEFLDDPGGFFKHPSGQSINLADIYVYPDLKRSSVNDDESREILNGADLLNSDSIKDGIIVEGEEKTGATSLLLRLYRHYHERDLIPIYVQGRDIKRSANDELDGVIRRAITKQYGKAALESIEQLPIYRKVILLDDFDDSKVKSSKHQGRLLLDIKKRFGHVVVTVGPMFEMKEILDGIPSEGISSLKNYRLQPFGYRRRFELIQRWFSLGADGSEDDGLFLAQCDRAERLMNIVMAKSLVPSLPFYLLTLLQSIEAGTSGDFKDSSLGYYYQFLLTRAFTESGVNQDKLTEMFQYSTLLAWRFHELGKRELSEDELRDFNSTFSKDWKTVDFGRQLDVLIDSRVLQRYGDEYSFRYPYIFYYLKGKYLGDNLADEVVKRYIAHCCEHLYVRDYANTVLFLSHHTNDDFVIDTIYDGLRGSFSSSAEITFNGDTDCVKKLIVDAPKLTYSGDSPVVHRQKQNGMRDATDDGRDGLAECEESESTLSLVAKLTMMFKTAEILGQILKNQYAKIKRPRKEALIEELFNAPLRAVSNFYDQLNSNPDSLIDEIETALKKNKNLDRDEIRLIATRVVSEVIHMLTFAFVIKSAQSVNADNLLENIRDVVKSKNTRAFRLIELAVLLDSPNSIPRGPLKSLYVEMNHDLIFERLIHVLVLNRIYMFKTSQNDMQWISSEIGINLVKQQKISYIDSTQRVLE